MAGRPCLWMEGVHTAAGKHVREAPLGFLREAGMSRGQGLGCSVWALRTLRTLEGSVGCGFRPAKGRAAMLAASPCGGHGPKTCPGGQAQLGPALPSRDRVSFGLQALRFCCIRELIWGDAFPTFPCRESPRPPGEETGPRGEPSAPGSEDGGLRASLLSQFGGGDPSIRLESSVLPTPLLSAPLANGRPCGPVPKPASLAQACGLLAASFPAAPGGAPSNLQLFQARMQTSRLSSSLSSSVTSRSVPRSHLPTLTESETYFLLFSLQSVPKSSRFLEVQEAHSVFQKMLKFVRAHHSFICR